MKDIYVYGSGGHAKVIIDIIEQAGNLSIKGIIDIENIGSEVFGYKIKSQDKIPFDNELIIGIGNNKIRKKVSLECHLNNLSTIIAKFSSISIRAKVARGTVIMPGVTVNAMTSIGENCILNTNCSVDHDCNIGDFVHISPNATLCGQVTIKEGTHIGAGATIIPGVTIGEWCTIGAGAIIIKDVPDNCVVVGNPGKIIKSI